jgi:hypothetical protein
MLKKCPDADSDLSLVQNASAGAAPDNALRDPARDVTPSGTPHCKNAGTNVRA